MKTINYREGLLQRLKNKKYAFGLLQTAFEESCNDGNWEAFGVVLEDVIEAQSSKKDFAEKVRLSRQHLYRLFGKKANPTLNTLLPVLSELGFTLTLSPSHIEKRRKSA